MKLKLTTLIVVTCFAISAFAKIGDTEAKWLTHFPGTRLVARDTYKGHKRMAVQFPDGGQVVGVFVNNSCEFQTSLTPRNKSREPSSSDVEKVADQYGGHLDSWVFLSPNENYKQWVRPDGQLQIVVQKEPDGRWSLSTIAGAMLAEVTGSSSANVAQKSAPAPDRGLQPTVDTPELITMAEATATPHRNQPSTPTLEPTATEPATLAEGIKSLEEQMVGQLEQPEGPKGAPVAVDCPADDDGKANAPIIVKGFYLGMPLGCAVKLINEKYSAAFGKIEVKRGHPEFREIDMAGLMELGASQPTIGGDLSSRIGEAEAVEQAKERAFAPNLHKATFRKTAYTIVRKGNSLIEADDHQKVIAFNFPAKIVDALFNTDGINAQDFAKKFLDSYLPNFSEMNPFVRENSLMPGRMDNGLEYTGDNGIHIQIDTNKNVIIESVPSSKDTKFD